MIIGRDVMKTLGLIIDFENELITWGKYHANMKPSSVSVNDSYSIDDPRGVDELVGRMAGDNYKKILDAKYEKADIEKTVSERCAHLSKPKQTSSKHCLTEHSVLGKVPSITLNYKKVQNLITEGPTVCQKPTNNRSG